jgi:hypothetical protein
MLTIKEKLIKWREEDVDADTHIIDNELHTLEEIVYEITKDISEEYLNFIKENFRNKEDN